MADPAQQAIIGRLVEYLVDALKDQVSYLCCYSCNVPKLAEEVEKLNEKYEGVQVRANAARDNLEIITPEVESWQKRVEKVQEDSKNIVADAEQVGKSCLCKWFPVLHYSLSRDAVKTTESAIELRKEVLPDPISIPRRLAEIAPVPHPSEEYKFKSRDEIEAKIMDALMDQSVYLIGLHGMGGIGKTTLARKIEARARKEKSIFQHVVMATVSQQPNLPKIQKVIAEGLGLKLSEDEPLNYGAEKLHMRLMNAKGGVLVILDDVWEILKLDDLGIPSQKNCVGFKLILTSRGKHNFNIIGNPKSEIFELGILKKEESWTLFKRNVGGAIDSDPDLDEIAKDIVKECEGLPLALEVVGCALRGKDKSYWENALKELQRSMPTNIEGVEQRVYRPLMCSIELLESPDAKGLLLLCCLFPEDYQISLEELVRRGMGLRIFEEEELMEAGKKVKSVLDNLISRALLIKCIWTDTLHVQMHDVIRDVGIWIASKKKIESEKGDASKEKHVFMISHGRDKWPMIEEESYGCYTCISLRFSQQDVNIPEFIDCPRLELLDIALIDRWRTSFLNIPENFFSRMGRLRVLEASSFSSLPSSVGLLKNLRTLYLNNCKMSIEVSMIGKLTNLEILCLESCEVDVLPKEIGGLKKLRQLDISECTGLEKLEVEDCSELGELHIKKLFAGNFSGLQKLEVNSIHKLKCLLSPSILSGFSNLEKLTIGDCTELEAVIGKDESVGETIVFPKLWQLCLSNLPKVLAFCYTDVVELPSLAILQITSCPLMERFSQRLSDTSNSRFSLSFFNKEVYCPKLRYLCLYKLNNIANIFTPPAFSALINLKRLNVRNCEKLEEVIGKEETEEILSPPLEELDLWNLPKIHRFCRMKHCLEFPSLEKVSIYDCPVLERFSLGPLHLPNFTRLNGLLDANFAAKFFFNKEISSYQSHVKENNCFTISIREISLSFGGSEGPQLKWFLTPSSSESFVDALELTRFKKSIEIIGNFETTKLLAGVAYEIMLIIMLDKYGFDWGEFEIGLTLSGGITQQCSKILNKLPKNKWIEISLGNIKRESHQNGQLEFVLHQRGGGGSYQTLCIKDVRIMKAKKSHAIG